MKDKPNEDEKIVNVNFNKTNTSKENVLTLFPYVTFPFDLNAETLLMLGDADLAEKSLSNRIWKAYHKHQISSIDGKRLQCLMGLDTEGTISDLEEKDTKYELFIPDKVKESQKLYFSDLSSRGIKLFTLLKKQPETTDLKLWTALYKKLVDKGTLDKFEYTKSIEEINQSELNEFLQYFDKEYQDEIKKLLVNDRGEISMQILRIDDLK